MVTRREPLPAPLLGRAIAASTIVHAGLLLIVVMVVLRGARGAGDEEELAIVDVMGAARSVEDVRRLIADEPARAPAVAADEDRVEYVWSAPSRAPSPDRNAREAAASNGDGAGIPDPANTGRRDTDTMHAQLYDVDAGRYQLERIHTGRDRQSPEQIRAVSVAGASAYLASQVGSGTARTRPGARDLVDGKRAGAPRESVEGDGRDRPSSTSNAPWVAGQKIGVDGEDAAGFARPDEHEGPVATDAARTARTESDDRTLARVSSDMRPGPIELSNPSVRGPGDRGRGEGDQVAWSYRGRGREAVPGGNPDAPYAETLAQSTYRRHYNLYLSDVKRKIDPLWELPKDVALRLESGEVVVGFIIRRDGSVKDVKVIKTSGIKSFDRVVLAAIEKASPFAPLPAIFGKELPVTAPFAGDNPIIR